jgi:hypothetical protein
VVNQSAEYQGYWWLPDEPEEKVSGTLKFTPDDGAILDLVGSFGGIKGSVGTMADLFPSPESGLILGFSVNGKAITLRNCKMTRGSLGMPGFATSTYSADMVIVGEHFERPEDIGFEVLSVEYAHLEEWAGISGFELKMPQDPKNHPYVIEHQIPERISVSVGETSISLMFGANYELSNPLVRTASITQKVNIRVEFPEKKPMDDLLGIIYRIQNFLSLGVRDPVYPLSVKSTTSTKSSGETPSVEIYYRPLGRTESTDKVHPVDMLFTLNALPGGLDCALRAWFERAEVLEPVYQLYLGTVYNPNAFLEQRFLNLVQALEAYHRRAMPTTDLPEVEHERRKEDILRAVPDHYREWLEGKLRYSNEPGLGKRLKDIIRRYPETAYPIAGSNSKEREKFVRKIVDTRNYRTHFDESLEGRAARGEELYRISEKLKLLTEMSLIGEIGFGDVEIKRAVLGVR